MAFTSVSRRQILSSLVAAGGITRLAPFLPTAVHAAGTPKRILSVFHPMGYLEHSFWPGGARVAGDDNFASGGTSDFQLGQTMTALEPWKGKLIFPDGLYLGGVGWMPNEDDNEHGLGIKSAFTGSESRGQSSGPSIEQVVADFQYAQVKTRFRALAVGVGAGSGGGHASCFYSKAQTPVVVQNSPQATFDSLFKDFVAPNAPATDTSKPPVIDTSAADRLRMQKQSVLDMVRTDLNRLKAVSGSDNSRRIEAHLDGLSSLENRLKTLVPVTPGGVAGPSAPAGSVTVGCAKPTLRSGEDPVGTVQTQVDLIAAAFACDLTRTASLQLGGADGWREIDGLGNQHNVTHASAGGPAELDAHRKWDRWWASQWAYLLGKLDSIKEGNGTLLDNTLIVFGSDTTTAQSFNETGAHHFYRFPLWMAGGGNFAFKTGKHIKLPMGPAPKSLAACRSWKATHQRLHTSIARAFGMNIDKFGTSDSMYTGSGPLMGLTPV